MLKTGLGHLQCYRHPRLLQVFDRKNVYDTVKKEQNDTYMGMEKKPSCKSEVKAPLFGWRRGRLLYLLCFGCWLWLGLEVGRVGGRGGKQFITHRENRISRTPASLSPPLSSLKCLPSCVLWWCYRLRTLLEGPFPNAPNRALEANECS